MQLRFLFKLILLISITINIILTLALFDKILARNIIKLGAIIAIPIIHPTDPLLRYYSYQGLEPYLDFLDGNKVNVLDYTEEDRKNKAEIEIRNKFNKSNTFIPLIKG